MSGTPPHQITIWFDGCGHPDEVCGEILYADPDHPEFTLCAPDLIFLGRRGNRDVFDASPAYRADACLLEMRLELAAGDDPATIDIDQYIGANSIPSYHAVVTKISDSPLADDPVPALPPLAGLNGPMVATELEYPTTPYSAADGLKAYFPMQGDVVSVDVDSGELDSLAYKHDDGNAFDPHAVAESGGTIWEGRAPENTIEVVTDFSGSVHASNIQLKHPPYDLAADGDTLWVTSRDDAVLMRVDSATGSVVATIAMEEPTGVAVGQGFVWVIDQNGPYLMVIDPATNEIVRSVRIDGSDHSQDCGACADSVIYADGSAWTANNYARSITRVDGKSFEATTIPTTNRVWSVAANGGYVYGSQFEEADGYIDRSVGGLVRIDPKTGKAEQLSAPGVLGVAALADYLWLIVPQSRGNYVMSYRPT